MKVHLKWLHSPGSFMSPVKFNKFADLLGLLITVLLLSFEGVACFNKHLNSDYSQFTFSFTVSNILQRSQ